MGKQAYGMVFNTIGQWVIGLPVAVLLAFKFHKGVEGLVLGLLCGVTFQAICYVYVITPATGQHGCDCHPTRIRMC